MARYTREITLQADNAGCDRAGAPIVRGVSFTLEPGGAIQLFGANGSGKTSLLSLFAAHIDPAEGAVVWRDQAGHQQEQPFEESLVFVGHDVSIKPALTAEENLQFWAALYGVNKTDQSQQIDAALSRMGMVGLRHMRAGRMSAGQRRRIDLARLLLARRAVWLMDEPATAIDASGVEILRSVIAEHLDCGGIAVVATHDELGVALRKMEIGE